MKHVRAALAVVVSIAAVGAAQGAQAAGRACPNPAFQREAQAAIDAYKQDDVFSGAVLVAVDGHPVLRWGVGLADRELATPATPNMKFRIGPITKQFTATAILQLQEAGKLSVDDPVSKYYTDAPPAWARITIRHLLNHRSGIPSYTGLPGFFDREARLPKTPEELIKLTRDKPLEFEPGSRFAYDNSGYILLGYIVEKVSGERYADYLQKHIFGPLGMAHSGFDETGPIMVGRAHGYDRGRDGAWRNAAFLDMSVPYAAGSLYSTVDDLLIWDQAIYAGRLLTPESLKAMFTDAGSHYGFGFVIDQKWGQDRIWHNGGINGFTASFQRYIKPHVTAIALANEATGATDKVAADLAGLCLGADVYPKPASETPAALARDAGFYELSPTAVVELQVRGGTLVGRTTGQPDITYYPQGGGGFFARTVDAAIKLDTGPDGRATAATFKQGLQSLHAKRIDAAEAARLASARGAGQPHGRAGRQRGGAAPGDRGGAVRRGRLQPPRRQARPRDAAPVPRPEGAPGRAGRPYVAQVRGRRPGRGGHLRVRIREGIAGMANLTRRRRPDRRALRPASVVGLRPRPPGSR